MSNILFNPQNNHNDHSFDEFMHQNLHTNHNAYYQHQQFLGSKGDFITAPEISQIFGELIAICLLQMLQSFPDNIPLNLVELGAGRGTLLQDILRVIQQYPDLNTRLNIHIIDINQPYIQQQKQQFNKYNNIKWYNSIHELKLQDIIIIYSNEFFDALPVKQYVKNIQQHWYELCVTQHHNHRKLIYNKLPNIPQLPYAPYELINHHGLLTYETSVYGNEIFTKLLQCIKHATGGGILTIDYGDIYPQNKNTIRGFANHKIIDIDELVQTQQITDITYNVNFYELQQLAQQQQFTTYNILTQQQFLENLFINQRLQKLLAHNQLTNNTQQELIDGVNKLINPQQMGTIFKTMLHTFNIKQTIFPFTPNQPL